MLLVTLRCTWVGGVCCLLRCVTHKWVGLKKVLLERCVSQRFLVNNIYLVKRLFIFEYIYIYHPTIFIEFIHVLLLLVKIVFVDVLVAFFPQVVHI